MSLLREIQDAAIDSKTDISSLLRKCKVLAARLGNDEFKKWVESELSGYGSIEDLPDYRVLTVNSKGNFSGAFGSGLRNADIPLGCISEQYREKLQHAYLQMAIAAMDSLVTKNKSGALQEPWNPNLVAIVGRKIYEHMNCMEAWKVIPAPAVVAAIDAVRTRVLNFVLEIEATNPKAGEAQLNSNPIPQDKVQQIFNTYVTGNVQNLATGNTGGVSQNAEQVHSTDMAALMDLLGAIRLSDVPPSVKQEMEAHLDGMQSSLGTVGFKDHYVKFMGVLADHMQVLGVVVAPFLPTLTSMLP